MASPNEDSDYYDVVFLHPDLGIGGAERAIVDAAVALQHAPPPLPLSDYESSADETQEGVRRRTGLKATNNSNEPAGNGTGVRSGGYRVLVITAHHDPSRCFDETRDGTLRVIVAGSRIPRSIFGLQNSCISAQFTIRQSIRYSDIQYFHILTFSKNIAVFIISI